MFCEFVNLKEEMMFNRKWIVGVVCVVVLVVLMFVCVEVCVFFVEL